MERQYGKNLGSTEVHMYIGLKFQVRHALLLNLVRLQPGELGEEGGYCYRNAEL